MTFSSNVGGYAPEYASCYFKMKVGTEIVTENLSLLERFLMPVKNMPNEGF